MILYISMGEKIRISQERLIIEIKEDKKEIALKDIKVIIFENNKTSVTISSLLKLNEHKILTILCNERCQPQLQILDLYSNYKVTERINEQIRWSKKDKIRCFLGIIKCKLKHQKELLKYFSKDNEVSQLEELIKKLNRTMKSEEIRAIEGLGARIYFQGLFGKRFKRFENDVENMGLNYGYTILRALISKIIIAKGLHPSLGIEHKSILNNFNLSDDIIEIFRPMVDYIVYFYISSYESLEWECKNKLLELLYQKVKFDKKMLGLDVAIEKYIDEIITFMSKKTRKINFPSLEIEKYEY